ncbi:MAG: S66 peptidase family protein [Candidatus Shapirobacteria bacterium]
MFPDKLKRGDEIRVIAPAGSMAILTKETREIANSRLSAMGFKISFGKHVDECDDFGSSPVESRVEDLHQAFADKNIKAVLATIGGFNCNQMFRYIDWELINNNPKIICGFSDITALNNAFFAKTGLVNYSGLCYSNFGQKLYFEYNQEYFEKCVMRDETFKVKPSSEWTDDKWYEDQDNRNPAKNAGWLIINEGRAEGTILGSNLCTLNLLQGTEYMPSLADSILFLEDDYESKIVNFDRDLQSLIHLPDFEKVKGIVLGRFQKASNVSDKLIIEMIKGKKELEKIPVIANVDFGHTDPRVTFPIGGGVIIDINGKSLTINIVEH